ncbi:MAG: hypothetical protein M0R03_00495 [Novosphingobium sp.]|jgi:hypothetical protein|nr:hypothetical protein [Novosphingobium sp.]
MHWTDLFAVRCRLADRAERGSIFIDCRQILPTAGAAAIVLALFTSRTELVYAGNQLGREWKFAQVYKQRSKVAIYGMLVAIA